MESKAGSILALIGGILTLIVSLILLIAGIAFLAGYGEGDTTIGGIAFLVLFLIVLILGILKIVASNKMKKPETTRGGGILALILGIITSDLLTLIGGIIGIVQGGK
jgi:hypothetical protein